MEFTVYSHEIIPGSDIGMHFSASLELSVGDARDYRRALRILDPTAPPIGTLAIYELVLVMPDVATMIDLLNSPESLLRICLKSRRTIATSGE